MMEGGLYKTQISGNNYTICGKIGEGGAGSVFLAKDKNGTSYALKVIRIDKRNPIQKQMIDGQIDIQKQFKGNMYVIQFIDVKKSQSEVSIILELGEYSLRNALDIRKISEKDLLDIICDVASGLHSIHQQNVMHRDIKPENIIFKGGVYKITDFGISIEDQKDDSVIGTVPYWAPEMLFEQDKFTNKLDIWSLAVTAFECYFKVHPFCPVKGLNQKQIINQMKQNISQLTPDFNMQKFEKLLQKKKCKQQLDYVRKKLQNTKNQSIINCLCSMFQPDPLKRHSIEMVLAIAKSIQETYPPRNPKKTKINQKYDLSIIPDDIKMFIQAKDLFYDINHDQKSPLYEKTLFGLEIAIWYLQGANYGGIHYVKLDRINIIKDYTQPKQILWKQVFDDLSKYYYQLKFNGGNEQILYFDKLNQLRMHIIVCSVWLNIISDGVYCKRVSQITGFEIFNALQLMQMLQLISEQKLEKIEQMILKYYY